MSFLDWLYSNRPEGYVREALPWGILHIIVLLSVILLCIVVGILFRKKDEKSKKIILFIVIGVIAFFEITRRVVNFSRDNYDWTDIRGVLATLLPRPWCAISCWLMIASLFVNKKYFYNFTAITSLISAIVFFAYPDAGFLSHIAFEEVYSIVTHCMILFGAVSLITLGFTDFRYNRGKEKIWHEYLCYCILYLYAFIEIIFGIEKDPLYFMPDNGVNYILSLPYPLYLIIYVVFIFGIWTNAYYLIPMLIKKIRKEV